MPRGDPDQNKPVKKQANSTLAQRGAVFQERAKKLGLVSDASDDKGCMDETWGKDSATLDAGDIKMLPAALDTGMNSGAPTTTVRSLLDRGHATLASSAWP